MITTVAPARSRARRTVVRPDESTSSAASMPMTRPAIGAGSAGMSERAGEAGMLFAGFPEGAGFPRAAATWAQRSVSTSARLATIRSLMSSSRHLPSSKENAATM